MKQQKRHKLCGGLILCAMLIMPELSYSASLKPRKARGYQLEVIQELTDKGKQLELKYANLMDSSLANIKAGLPSLDGSKSAASLQVVKDLSAAKISLLNSEKPLRKNQAVIDGKDIKVAKERLEVAPVRLAAAKDQLEWALALPETTKDKAAKVKYAEKNLKKRTSDLEAAPGFLKKVQLKLEEAKSANAQLEATYQKALTDYQQAIETADKALEALTLKGLLASSELDGDLVIYKIISDATPRSLAQFAQQGAKQEKFIEQLFSDKKLMIQMVAAEGAFWGKYGAAMQIYDTIQKTSSKAGDGVLQKMAVAVSLVHAVPMLQVSAEADTDAETVQYVDPVERYLSYEKWYLDGELDPSFKDLSTWELKMVVDQETPNELLVWAREMLRDFRPDYLDIDHELGRYVTVVNSEISYGSGDVKLDCADQHRYHNILANGGICGRRAYFGRFVLKAFGIPTVERPEPGHATLAHWTPNGWQTRLGGNWGGRSWMSIEGEKTHNINFLEMTQARESDEGFMQIMRAQWIGHAMGEALVAGFYGTGGKRAKLMIQEEIAIWHAIALIKQSQVIRELKSQATAAGKAFGHASTFHHYIDLPGYEPSAADRKITINANGTIIIPASACDLPDPNLAISGEMGVHTALRFMKSSLGGSQLHYGRYSSGLKFSLSVDAVEAGEYLLSTRLITARPEEKLSISVNGAPSIEKPLPYTVGNWGESDPIKVTLKNGENTLTISRSWDSSKGMSFKDFKLIPVK